MAFEDFCINGNKTSSLTIAGKAVKELWINGKQVKQAASAPLTIKANLWFNDDDLTLAASGDITPEFTVKCYSASGSDLGSYTFKQAMTSSTRASLITLMKAAGIDVDSMKVKGARFEFTDVKQWSTNDVYIKLSGTTSHCFVTYGSLDETFKGANADWSMAYFF